MERITAIVLAGGSGKRMKSAVPKQYLTLAGKPVIYYALRAFDESAVTDIVLVAGAGDADYCREEIIRRYGIRKVRAVVEGGKERYDSVYRGLLAAEDADYVLIHDGARPLVTAEVIARALAGAREYGACVAGMPVKDTVRLVGGDEFADATPDRRLLRQIQTPQAFCGPLIRDAYAKVLADIEQGRVEGRGITDDAMILEYAAGRRVKVTEGSYRNLKITTPEDLILAEAYLKAAENSD